MPTALVNGVNLYYEVTGKGLPLVWCHEFAGDYRSWDDQVKFFSRRYQNITYNARGYPPSAVPTEPAAYSQDNSIEDLYQLLNHLDIKQAYIGGLSMGGNVALNFGMAHPEKVKALIVAGTGAGTTDRQSFEKRWEGVAKGFIAEGMRAMLERYYAAEPNRIQLRRKDAKTWQEFCDGFTEHSPVGSALTIRHVLRERPVIFALEPKLKKLTVPTLIVAGDEDAACIESSIFMKRNIPRAGLVVFPQTGHTINLEEPHAFNRVVSDFLAAVEAGSWV